MRKKLLYLLPLLVFAISLCMFCAVGCEEETVNGECKQHDWGEYTVVTEPTCTTTGQHIRTCKICGKEDPSTLIPALGHDWGDPVVETPATCEKTGTSVRICKNDPTHRETSTIKALEHKWEVSRVIQEPDCLHKGSQEMVCKNDPSHTKTVDLAPTGHKWGDWNWTTKGDCVTAGHRDHQCTVCQFSEGEDVPAPGHQWGEWSDWSSESCTEGSSATHTCTVCKTEETYERAPLGHDWSEWTVDTKPDCTHEGKRHRSCSVCDEKQEETLKALGHFYEFTVKTPASQSAEGREEGTCSVCSDTITRAIPKIGAPTGIYRIVVSKTNGRMITTWKEGQDGLDYRYYTDGGFNRHYTTEITIKKKSNNEFVYRGNLIAEDYSSLYAREVVPHLEIELPIDDYIVTLGDIPDGYIYQAQYEMPKNSFIRFEPGEDGNSTKTDETKLSSATKATDPINIHGDKVATDEKNLSASLTVVLTSKKSDGRLPDKFNVKTVDGKTGGLFKGAIIPDFSLTTVDNEVITLSDLLKTKKVVILDIYFYNCPWCQTAAPDFVRFAEKYKDDIAVICLNTRDSSVSTAKKIYDKSGGFKYPEWFYCVLDYQTQFFYNLEKIGTDVGNPTQVVIDQGFCVADFIRSYNEDGAERLFRNLPDGFNRDFDAEWNETTQVTDAATPVYPAVLPERKELFA